jgi:hypothetical protein
VAPHAEVRVLVVKESPIEDGDQEKHREVRHVHVSVNRYEQWGRLPVLVACQGNSY